MELESDFSKYFDVENDEEYSKLLNLYDSFSSYDIWEFYECQMKSNPYIRKIGERTYNENTCKYNNYSLMTLKDTYIISETLGKGLAEIGVKEESIVYLWMRQRIEFAFILMAVYRQGGICAPQAEGLTLFVDYLRFIEPSFALIEPEFSEEFLCQCRELFKESKLKIKAVIILPHKTGPDHYKQQVSQSIIEMFENIKVKVYLFQQIIEIGKKAKHPHNKVNQSNLALLVSSSGTTQSKLKVISITQKNIITTALLMKQFIKDRHYLMHGPLSMGHISDGFIIICSLISDFIIGFPSDGKNNLFDDLKVLKPKALYTIPIFIKSLYDAAVELKSTKKITLREASNMIYKDKLGGEIKYIHTFGCILPHDLVDWIVNTLDLEYINHYGSSEIVAVFCERINKENFSSLPSYFLTKRPKYVKVRIKENDEAEETNEDEKLSSSSESNVKGELLIKAENLFVGYYKDKELTEESIDKEGFYHSGDIVEYDQQSECLRIIGRGKNMFKLANAVTVPADFLESCVTSSNLFKHANVIGDQKDIKLICIIVLNVKSLISNYDLPESIKSPLSNIDSLSDQEIATLRKNEHITRIIHEELDKIYEEKQIPDVWKFTDLIVDFKNWTLQDDCLTVTGKVKRRSSLIKYKNEILIIKNKCDRRYKSNCEVMNLSQKKMFGI